MSSRRTFFLLSLFTLSLTAACGSDDGGSQGNLFPGGNSGSAGSEQAGGSSGSGGEGDAGAAGASGEGGSASDAGGSGGAGDGGAGGTSGNAGSGGSAGHPYDGDDVTPRHVRIIAANLSSGKKQSYTDGEGIRILHALQPDVVLIQEMNYKQNTSADIAALAEATMGAPAHFYREPSGAIPNGIISRYPIIASGTWAQPNLSDRGFAWARIDVPGPDDLWAVSVHLKADSGSASSRNTQAAALMGLLSPLVPPSDLLVVGGDLNTQSRGESCINTLSQLLDVAAPYPSDSALPGGNGNTNSTRNKPYDWVLTDGDLRQREVGVAIGEQVFSSGLVFDSRTFAPLGDLPGVLATDSGAEGMQHMAVVREFVIGAE